MEYTAYATLTYERTFAPAHGVKVLLGYSEATYSRSHIARGASSSRAPSPSRCWRG